jgi:hypothetical protein
VVLLVGIIALSIGYSLGNRIAFYAGLFLVGAGVLVGVIHLLTRRGD